ncbi:MAG: DUF4340 domain-containing protein [Gammaproteobacteria bacterium]
MRARLWLNIGLLLLVLALALLAYYQPGLAPQPPAKLTSLGAQHVTRLRIEQDGQPPLVLEKQAGKWSITGPVRVEANTLRVETVLRLAEAESLARFPARDLERFKLDTPLLRVWLNDVEIAFGDSAPLGRQRYLLLDGTVHLIADEVYYYLRGGLPLFAGNNLLPQGAQLQSLALPGFSLVRADGRWRLDPSREVSMDDVNQFLDAWRGAQALQVTRYQNQAAQDKVQVRLQDGAIEFLVLAREPELILARPDVGLQYHLGSGAAQRLLQWPQADEISTGTDAGR